MHHRIHCVHEAVRGRPRPRVFVAEWLDPPFAAGHWVPEMVDMAGGDEVLGRARERSYPTTWEAVHAKSPQLIVLAPCGFDVERTVAEAAGVPSLGARMVAVDGDAASPAPARESPRASRSSPPHAPGRGRRTTARGTSTGPPLTSDLRFSSGDGRNDTARPTAGARGARSPATPCSAQPSRRAVSARRATARPCSSSGRSTATRAPASRSSAGSSTTPRRAGCACRVLPDLNPDGVRAGTRGNAHGVDLNRNFAWRWSPQTAPGTTYYAGPRALSEPETRFARLLITRLRPDITIWFHQSETAVDISSGSTAIEARFARRVALPLRRLVRYAGSATTWQAHRFPKATAFVVELPARCSAQRERDARVCASRAGARAQGFSRTLVGPASDRILAGKQVLGRHAGDGDRG